MPAGWSLTLIGCTGDTTGLVIGRYASDPLAFVNGGTNGYEAGDTTIRVTIDAGESVVCTFTNTEHASVTYQKETVPASDPQDFVFGVTGSGLTEDTLDTDGASATPSSHTDNLTPDQFGAKTIMETTVTGWDLTALTAVVTPTSPTTSTQGRWTSTLTLARRSSAPSRTRSSPSFIVQKVTKPADSPTNFPFEVTGTGYLPFSLTGQAASNTNTQTLIPGYLHREGNGSDGWVLTGIGGSSDIHQAIRVHVTGRGGSSGAAT